MENIDPNNEMRVYYQINYTLTEVPEDAAYFHAQFRRSNPNINSDHVLVDGIKGKGQYVGTYIAWQVNNNGWWGEGEIKFFMDGDKKFPTICGTGTEDYFCGSYNFENKTTHQYEEFTTPYAGLHQIIRPDGVYRSQQRFGMYRWHILDPIRFEKDLKVTIQDLGWRNDGRNQRRKTLAVTFVGPNQIDHFVHFFRSGNEHLVDKSLQHSVQISSITRKTDDIDPLRIARERRRQPDIDLVENSADIRTAVLQLVHSDRDLRQRHNPFALVVADGYIAGFDLVQIIRLVATDAERKNT